MLSFLHLVTVGTNIIRNASMSESISGDIREKLKSWAMTPPRSSGDLEAGNRAVPGAEEFRAVLGFVSGSPRRASAELNAFIGYLKRLEENGVVGVSHHIVLLGTDTGAGWFCVRIIEEYLKDMVGQDISKTWGIGGHVIGGVEAYRVEKLGVDFSEGILNLIALIKQEILRKSSGYDRILANLTGGFKPESAAILVAAGLLGIDTVYYIHEVMKDIVELPVIPLRIDDNARKLLENALKGWIGKAERRLLDKIGLRVEDNKLSPWARRLLEIILY